MRTKIVFDKFYENIKLPALTQVYRQIKSFEKQKGDTYPIWIELTV